jgi:ATP-dependent Lhr-like helicase
MKHPALSGFHPAVSAWFEGRFEAPTAPQERAWPSIQAGRPTLIAAPTGSGKTLAAFLCAVDSLVRRALAGTLEDATQVLYVSPLKALSNDVQRNLEEPLAEIREELVRQGLPPVEIRTLVRTGDTPTAARAGMLRHPPHILVTTPESLFILLGSDGGRGLLKSVRSVIVDEIHAVAPSKRGSHLALSLARLEALVRADGGSLNRIGLSATQRPIERIARFLVGSESVDAKGRAVCEIVDAGHNRELDLGIEIPGAPLDAVMANEVWEEVYDRLTTLISEHRTTLVFVNTRRMAERVARHLEERLGSGRVASHHGSMARDHRLDAEQRLKRGDLAVLVATASLELGIDIGTVDLVCQMGTTRSIATLLQRVGRSGHRLSAVPKGRIFPTSRDELVESVALIDAISRGELDTVIVPEQPLDILAQQIVAAVAVEEWSEDALFDLMRSADPYRNLRREDFDDIVAMLANGFTTRRGRRGAYLHHDAVNRRLRGRRGARLVALTSGGAIPDTADYQVLLEPTGTPIGTVHEDFAVESMPGDVFQLGNASWRIRKVEPGKVRVEDARGAPPSIPFWLGEAPARTAELSVAVARLRAEIATRVKEVGVAGATAELSARLGLDEAAILQLVTYLAGALRALGAMPTQDTLVVERFFDELGDQHLVMHAPFGSRLNRAWGLALRKRFCQSFNFELQAAASEDAIVLSLGPTHSFPLANTFRFLNSSSVRGVVTQALLDSPLFGVRWRWNASRSLALPRFRGGKRMPTAFVRQESEDLIAVVFPDQLACLENIVGEREIPDHPLVAQTLEDCLEEAMDTRGLEALLRRLESGSLELIARDLTEPSPLAHEILNARPYTFLDDAPLEERRTQAVLARRWLDPETANDLGALDPAAIERVKDEVWPDPANADELHDALLTHGLLTAGELERGGWAAWALELTRQGRAARLSPPEGLAMWVAAERLPELLAVHPDGVVDPPLTVPERYRRTWAAEDGLVELVRGRLEAVGPTTAAGLATSLAVRVLTIEAALGVLESEGFVLRGSFTSGVTGQEWCERRLLARIHRYTLDRLRREIEPVSAADYLRFLAAWQHLDPEGPGQQGALEGPDSVATVLTQLAGFEAPAAAWEGEILPARMKEYDPLWLDGYCLAGRCVWGRVSPPTNAGRNGKPHAGPVRATPIALLPREHVGVWTSLAKVAAEEPELTTSARSVLERLTSRGASFFGDIATATGLLHTQLETAVGELVAAGRLTADSFTGLRALLIPAHKRPAARGSRAIGVSAFTIANAGRWSLFERSTAAEGGEAEPVVHAAWTLLRRYGVVFRRLLERESLAPPWRDLLTVLRRLEARGEIRGGRFVAGFSGEQFALPEAIGQLRAVRKEMKKGRLLSVSAADPLNLVGILTPGERLPALAGNRLLMRDGEPIAVYEARQVRWLVELPLSERWAAESALIRRSVAPRLKAYLGRSA